MANEDFIARASIDIQASPRDVWKGLTDPALIAQYMFGTTVTAEWRAGGAITWRGEWEGKQYEDKGRVLKFEPTRRLQYTHFSPMSGLPDRPENYHTVTIELADGANGTDVSLSQYGNPTAEARDHAQQNWRTVLQGLKDLTEKAPRTHGLNAGKNPRR